MTDKLDDTIKRLGKLAKDMSEVAVNDPTGTIFNRRPGEVPHRNPDRIPHMINLLYAAWCISPDMRMGQLLMNAARHGGWGPNDIWNVEEEVFAKGFLEMIKEGGG